MKGAATMTEDAEVSFTRMKDGTREEYLMLHELEKPFQAGRQLGMF